MPASRLVTAMFVGFLALALPSAAFGAEAEQFVKDKQAELLVLLKGGKAPANEPKIEALFDQMLDYDTLAKESLGNYWNERSGAEKKEFQSVLKRLVQRAYRKNLSKTLSFDVTYRGEVKAKDGFLVKTVAKNRKNVREEPITIDYVLHKFDGRWRIRDIVTEGSSLTGNYRNQFTRIIKKKNFDELLKRMKSRLDKGES